MELNEKRQKAINEMEWRRLKKEFDELKTYPEKLTWWQINVPEPMQNHTDPNDPNHRTITNNYPIQFQYSGIGAPEVKNSVAFIFFSTKELNSPSTRETKEFISILPKSFNPEQQQQFWDWFTQKIELKSLEYWIDKYKNDLNIDSVFQPEIIRKLKNNLKIVSDNNLGNSFFEMGRNYGIHKKAEFLKIGDPERDFTTISKNVKDIMGGYELALKESALGKVEKSLNDKTEILEPIEDIPNPNKIKWLGTPSQFSYLFLELVRKGFIEQPLYRGETSPSRYAELCFNNFDIETTMNSLKTEFKNNSSLSETYRSKFTIPEKSESTDKRSGNNKKQ